MESAAKNRATKILSVILFLMALFLLFIFSLLHFKFGVGLMLGMCVIALLCFIAAKKKGANIKHLTTKDGFRIVLKENYENFFIASKLTINQLHALAKEIMAKKELYERIDAHQIGWISKWDSSVYKLYRFVAMDMVLGCEKMGIPMSPYSYALQGVLRFLLRTNKENFDYKFFNQAFKYYQHEIEEDVKQLKLLVQKAPERDSILLVAELLDGDINLQKKYYGLMYDYFKTLAKYTGKLTEQEVEFLNKMADLHNGLSVE